MSDLSTTSYTRDNGCNNSCDNGMNPIFIILLLLLLSGGDSCGAGGLFNFGNGNSCGCNKDGGCFGGLDGILPILLILLMCGGSFC